MSNSMELENENEQSILPVGKMEELIFQRNIHSVAQQSKEEISVHFFSKIGNFFRFRFNAQASVQDQAPPSPASVRFNELLANMNLQALCQMMQKGYAPDSRQEKNFNKKINHVLIKYQESSNGEAIIDSCIKSGLKLTHEEVADAILHWTEYLYDIKKSDFPPMLKKEVEKIMDEPGFSQLIFKKLQEDIFTNYGTRRRYEDRIANRSQEMLPVFENYTEQVLKEVSYKEFNDFYNKMNTMSHHYPVYDRVKIAFNEIMQKRYEKEMNEELDGYASPIAERLLSDTVRVSTKKMTLGQLDEETLGIVHSIEHYYGKIKQNHDENQDKRVLDPLQASQLEILFEKRIPEILEKYLSMNEEYRLTLTNNQGKNAKELMIESLNEIQNKFEQALKSINEEKLGQLSALNRYTKKV